MDMAEFIRKYGTLSASIIIKELAFRIIDENKPLAEQAIKLADNLESALENSTEARTISANKSVAEILANQQ